MQFVNPEKLHTFSALSLDKLNAVSLYALIVVDSVLASVFGTGTFYPKTTTLNTVIVGNDNPGIYEETRNVE